MPITRQLKARKGDVLLMVGTSKGAFLFSSNGTRITWKRGGPLFPGEAVNAMAFDPRDQRLYVASESMHWGPTLRWSDDLGRTWSVPESAAPQFPKDAGVSVEKVWQLCPAGADEPGVIWAGVAPAALFRSADRGQSWELVRGLFDHPHRERWMPGAGGLCLHTILPDPARSGHMTIAISAAGVYRTEDGGATWRASNEGIRAEFLPDKHPEFGQCVHKIVRHPARPDTLFLQNHWGLYRSDDGGEHWRDIARGVPSDFGFCMAMHPHDPDVVYIVPLEADVFRCTPEGKLRVYRTRDGGTSWEALTQGLPQADAYETVLRDAMAVDELNPAGVYFGTRSGKLFGSANGGASWQLVTDGLPSVLCVRAAYVGDARRARAVAPAKRARSRVAAPARKPAKPRRKPAARKRAQR